MSAYLNVGIMRCCRVVALLHKIIDVIFRFAVSVTVLGVIIEVIIVLLVDHTEEFAIAVKDAACINGNPMDVHLKRIFVDIRHVLLKFLFQYVLFRVLRNAEQLPYVRPIYPVIEQLRTRVDVLTDELGEVVHILFSTVIRLDDVDTPFCKLFDVVVVVPFHPVQIHEIIPHFRIGFLEFLKQRGAELAEIADDSRTLVSIQLLKRVMTFSVEALLNDVLSHADKIGYSCDEFFGIDGHGIASVLLFHTIMFLIVKTYNSEKLSL